MKEPIKKKDLANQAVQTPASLSVKTALRSASITTKKAYHSTLH